MRGSLRRMMAAWAVVVGLGGPAAAAQTTEADIASRLVGKPLLLRGFWAEDKLVFHADGTPADMYKPGPFTLAGIDVTSVKLHGSLLSIDGQRVALIFDKSGNVSRLPLTIKGKKPETISMEINGSDDADYTSVLDAIFVQRLANIAPSLPNYWQPYARQHFLHEEPRPVMKDGFGRPLNPAEKVLHIGGSIRPPHVLRSVDPPFTNAARQLNFSGTSFIYLWVEPDGTSSHIEVARPVGMGLDEEAIAAVAQYKFAPAMQNGLPVRVDLYIDVNFRIF